MKPYKYTYKNEGSLVICIDDDGGETVIATAINEQWASIMVNGLRQLISYIGKPCYYCNELTEPLADNPGRWPIVLCHPDEPGVPKHHHAGCISQRLEPYIYTDNTKAAALLEQAREGLDGIIKYVQEQAAQNNLDWGLLAKNQVLVKAMKSQAAINAATGEK